MHLCPEAIDAYQSCPTVSFSQSYQQIINKNQGAVQRKLNYGQMEFTQILADAARENES